VAALTCTGPLLVSATDVVAVVRIASEAGAMSMESGCLQGGCCGGGGECGYWGMRCLKCLSARLSTLQHRENSQKEKERAGERAHEKVPRKGNRHDHSQRLKIKATWGNKKNNKINTTPRLARGAKVRMGAHESPRGKKKRNREAMSTWTKTKTKSLFLHGSK